jgi:tRNA threonylcarbamoyladenosine biosynthesis protein TsaB
VSAAQGLALGLDRPTLPLDSLMVVAEMARQTLVSVSRVGVAMDARMQEIYWGVYTWVGDAWRVEQQPCLLALAEWTANVNAWGTRAPDEPGLTATHTMVVVGSALDAWPDAWPSEGARVKSLSMREVIEQAGASRAQALAAVADQQLALVGRGQVELVDAAQAVPRYVRNQVALTTLERNAKKAASP